MPSLKPRIFHQVFIAKPTLSSGLEMLALRSEILASLSNSAAIQGHNRKLVFQCLKQPGKKKQKNKKHPTSFNWKQTHKCLDSEALVASPRGSNNAFFAPNRVFVEKPSSFLQGLFFLTRWRHEVLQQHI